ncbi:MAG: hypothetical protein AB1Z98_07560 [Nannocystaceae bacterium]
MSSSVSRVGWCGETAAWGLGLAILGAAPIGCGDDSGSETTEAATTQPGDTTTAATATGEPGSSSDPGTTTTPGTTSGTTGGTSGTSSGDGESGPPVIFDLGGVPESPKIDQGACGKVDFLFVIDNSGSMSDEQANLVASFPGFITAIQNSLEQVEEYNVGVVTSDAYSPNTAVPGCNQLGGLVVQTGGGNSSSAVCGPYADGNNYITQSDDLTMAFACAAQVGTSGNGFEQPMQALLNAVDPAHPLAMPGGCNEGFIREDALLVLVIITDEADGPGDSEGMTTPGTVMDWYDAVVAAKDGIPENVVVVSLVSYAGGPCPPSSAVFDGVNMVDFAMLFGSNGVVGGVCLPDYGPTFADAVSVIDVACDNFMPPS